MFKKLAGYFITISCLFYIFFNIKKENISLIKYFDNINNVLICVVAVILIGVTVNVSALMYVKILKTVSDKDFQSTVMRKSYLYSNFGKYLPGNFMHYAGRNILGSKLGISHGDIVLASVLEILFSLVGAFLVIITFSKASSVYIFSSVKAHLGLYTIILSAIILVLIIIFNKRKKDILKYLNMLRCKEISWLAVKSIIVYYLIFLTISFSYIMVILFIINKDFQVHRLGIIIAAFVLSWFIGFITPGSPGGIGVREATLLYFLNNFLPHEIIVASLILHRLINIAGDFMALLIGMMFSLIKDGQDVNDAGNF